MDKRVGLKRYELNGRKVLFYFDEVSFIFVPPCFVQQALLTSKNTACVVMMDEECLQRVGENFVNICVSQHLHTFLVVFVLIVSVFCLPFLDPQPVYDVCGLPSCQRIHRGQDSACSGQDLWLLRTRCASDEYFKCCSLKCCRAGKPSNWQWFMKWLLFLWEWEFFFSKFMT